MQEPTALCWWVAPHTCDTTSKLQEERRTEVLKVFARYAGRAAHASLLAVTACLDNLSEDDPGQASARPLSQDMVKLASVQLGRCQMGTAGQTEMRKPHRIGMQENIHVFDHELLCQTSGQINVLVLDITDRGGRDG
jgi:hypothetical protein